MNFRKTLRPIPSPFGAVGFITKVIVFGRCAFTPKICCLESAQVTGLRLIRCPGPTVLWKLECNGWPVRMA